MPPVSNYKWLNDEKDDSVSHSNTKLWEKIASFPNKHLDVLDLRAGTGP